jgi:ADP-heptose:LPS heptosyltransferase
MRPKLLVLELWRIGDLVLATHFLNVAARRFEVTLLAKPFASELQPRLWPGIEVIPFDFPWTAFTGKYRFYRWPWAALTSLTRKLRARRFDYAVSARQDPRDHALLRLISAPVRAGFPRLASALFLTDSLPPPPSGSHRYENWRRLGQHLRLELPGLGAAVPPRHGLETILIHTGARNRVRVWPLDRFHALSLHLRQIGYSVQIACDPGQRDWWVSREKNVVVPATLSELMTLMDGMALFVGNDSGPGHLAAILGIPTFTFFGAQLPSLFTPPHPQAEWLEGDPCPYKPCDDNCRFANPNCLYSIEARDALLRVSNFAAKHLKPAE